MLRGFTAGGAVAGWDDWLGVMLPFHEARELVRLLGVTSEAQYVAMKRQGEELERVDDEQWNAGHALRVATGSTHAVDTGRLPAHPEQYYRAEWTGWASFLGSDAACGA